jgi:signal transduction histidine kinase
MQYVALLLLAFLQVVISILMSYKKHLKVSRIFLVFSVILFIWTLANATLDHALRQWTGQNGQLDLVNFANRAGFFTGTITLILLYQIMKVFPVEIKKSKWSGLVTAIGVGVVLSTLFPIVSGNYIEEAGKPVYVYGALTPIIGVYFLVVAAISVKIVTKSLRKPLNPLVKSQAKTLLSALLLTMATTIFIVTILPLIVGNDSFIFLGYFSPYIFTVALFYSIFRQSFLDFRLIVARSLTYIFSLLSLGVIFIIGAFSITNLFFDGNNIDVTSLRWLYAVLAVVLAILFPPLKLFFDKVTNKLFFRDAYDTQAFLDEFNKNLVITHELDPLLKQSAKIIEKNLKPTCCLFLINGTKNTPPRMMGSGSKSQLDKKCAEEIKQLTSHTEQKLIETDELSGKHGHLQRLLRQEDIVLLVRLTPSLMTSRFDVGYLMIGPKKSGNLYSAQDLQVIEIIANELVIAVQNALRFEEIQNFNLTLQGRIDDATKKLRRANDKLRQMDETKDDFISMASHQLRTPLTSVKGYISMVLEGDGGKITHKQRDMLGQAFFSSQRMVYLIADLLNVSRLKTGKFIIEPTPVNLAQVVKEELEQLQETAAAHSLKLTYDHPKNFPELMLDETKIRQVIMNFVDNAIYYTPNGGHITVHLVDRKDTVELRVEDDGIGVPKSEQPHLFTKFYRAGNARKQRPDGTGLGLYMAKKVIVAQGGSLLFDSQEGKGSTFGFVFSKSRLLPSKTKK